MIKSLLNNITFLVAGVVACLILIGVNNANAGTTTEVKETYVGFKVHSCAVLNETDDNTLSACFQGVDSNGKINTVCVNNQDGKAKWEEAMSVSKGDLFTKSDSGQGYYVNFFKASDKPACLAYLKG